MHSTCRTEPLSWREGREQIPGEFEDAHFYDEYDDGGLTSDPAELSHKAVADSFSSPDPAGRLSLEFLQPLRASGFSTDPPASTTRQDARTGFSYRKVESGPLAAVGAYGIRPQGRGVCHAPLRLSRTWTLEPEVRMPDPVWASAGKEGR